MTEDKRLEGPMSPAGIEELRELEAKATPGPWTNSLGTIESSEGWHIASVLGYVGPITKGANAALIAAMRNALPRLLAMLQPPADAAVREALECGPTIDKVLFHVGDDGEGTLGGDAHLLIHHLRTLMSCVRPAQAELNAYGKAVAIKEKAASGFHEGAPVNSVQSQGLTGPALAVRNVLLSGFPRHMQSHAASEYTTLEMAEKLVEHLRTAERVRDENIQRWMRAEKSPRLTDAQVAALHIAQLRCLEEGNLSDVMEILESTFPGVFGKEG